MDTKDDLVSKDTALKMAISQFERIDKEYDCTEIIDICKEALEQPAQEIVHKVFDIDNFHSSVLDRIKFTSPQQWQGNKEFVGLSDDEIAKIIGKGAFYEWNDVEFARAIEQELKTKNGFSALKEKNNV